MARARRAEIPAGSLVNGFLPADYTDAYQCDIIVASLDSPDNANIAASEGGSTGLLPDDVMLAFWGYQPGWIRFLFRLRDLLVKPFGLKGGDGEGKERLEKCIRTGECSGFISVAAKSAHETVLRLDDKHLMALISVHQEPAGGEKTRLSVITAVFFHNLLGRVYFAAIRPFHHLVVRAMIEHTIKKVAS